MEKEFPNDILQKIEETKKLIQSSPSPECDRLLRVVSSRLLDIITTQTHDFIKSLKERKKVEEELRLFSRATEQSASSVIITNLAGTIIYVNEKFCQVTGYSKEEAIGQNPRIQKSGKQKPEFYKNLWETIKAGNDWSGEFHNKRKDGSLYWEHAVISPIKNEKGKITHYMAIKEDITARKNAEKELEKSRKRLQEEIATKNKFFSIISHDLRSPFTALLGYAEMLDEDYDSLTEEEKREYIHSLRETASHVFELLESLLKWARAQTDKLEFSPEEIDLPELVREVTALFAGNIKNKEINLILNIPQEVRIYADKDMIKTILRNFISNAIKFTPRGGKITVNYRETENDYVISVADTGIGISEKAKEAIFQLGTHYTRPGTEEEQGTGFGLSLVAELVKKHHGSVWVESEEGKGSEFFISIPKNLKKILENEK